MFFILFRIKFIYSKSVHDKFEGLKKTFLTNAGVPFFSQKNTKKTLKKQKVNNR